jgi:ABC-2 type transport system permease protein
MRYGMIHYLRLIAAFIRVSIQQEMAYRSDFFIGLLHSFLNLATGILAIVVLFGQVKMVHGWNFATTLALLGVYLLLGSFRGLFIDPCFNALAGIGGEVWTGRFDFTLLRPINAQFLVSFRYWRVFSLVDLILGTGVLVIAITQLHQVLTLLQLLEFLIALGIGVVVLYSILLIFTSLVFWSPGFLFTWIFDGLFQMARYPVGLYPGWVRFILTWIVPVGIMTTLPAQAIGGELPIPLLLISGIVSLVLLPGSSLLFQSGLRRYASASS